VGSIVWHVVRARERTIFFRFHFSLIFSHLHCYFICSFSLSSALCIHSHSSGVRLYGLMGRFRWGTFGRGDSFRLLIAWQVYLHRLFIEAYVLYWFLGFTNDLFYFCYKSIGHENLFLRISRLHGPKWIQMELELWGCQYILHQEKRMDHLDLMRWARRAKIEMVARLAGVGGVWHPCSFPSSTIRFSWFFCPQTPPDLKKHLYKGFPRLPWESAT
jgi:hypothetical protein